MEGTQIQRKSLSAFRSRLPLEMMAKILKLVSVSVPLGCLSHALKREHLVRFIPAGNNIHLQCKGVSYLIDMPEKMVERAENYTKATDNTFLRKGQDIFCGHSVLIYKKVKQTNTKTAK